MQVRDRASWATGLLALALLGCAPASEEASESEAAPMSTEAPVGAATPPEAPAALAPEAALAETFIDAFYAFDREAMRPWSRMRGTLEIASFGIRVGPRAETTPL